MEKQQPDAGNTWRLTKQEAEAWLRSHDGAPATVTAVIDEDGIQIKSGHLWVNLDAKDGRPQLVIAADPLDKHPQPLFEAAVSLVLDDKSRIVLKDPDEHGKSMMMLGRDNAVVQLFVDKPPQR